MGAVVNEASDQPVGAVNEASSQLADAVPAPVRVLLVDDEALMRAGLRLIIDGAAGISVVGEASDGQAALEQARELDPDVLLMDIRMPRMTGLEALAALRDSGTRARVVMLTAFDTDGFLLEALRGGAVSFLLKDSPPEQVVQTVIDAAHDRPRFSPQVLSRLVRLAADGAQPTASPSAPEHAGATTAPDATAAPEGITAREWDVGRLAAQGLTNLEVGEQLFLSVATVKTHLGRLFDKLQVTNRVQLAIRVLELGG